MLFCLSSQRTDLALAAALQPPWPPLSQTGATGQHAGAPQYNSTMFCEATMRQCYILNTTAASFVDARAACQALGGDSDLVQYTNGA